MFSTYEHYRKFIDTLASIISFSLFLYFFIADRKAKTYRDYWKGFLIIFVGSLLGWLRVVIWLPTSLDLLRKIIKTSLVIVGAYLVFRGGKMRHYERGKER